MITVTCRVKFFGYKRVGRVVFYFFNNNFRVSLLSNRVYFYLIVLERKNFGLHSSKWIVTVTSRF